MRNFKSPLSIAFAQKSTRYYFVKTKDSSIFCVFLEVSNFSETWFYGQKLRIFSKFLCFRRKRGRSFTVSSNDDHFVGKIVLFITSSKNFLQFLPQFWRGTFTFYPYDINYLKAENQNLYLQKYTHFIV